MGKSAHVLQVAGREVRVSNPDKLYFPRAGITKLDLVRYYLAVGEGAVRALWNRPVVLKRYVNGVEEDPFFQKRAPAKRPEWVETVRLSFPSGRTADEIVVTDLAQLIWLVNLGCVDQNPHPIRADDLEHPDELRVDLDPGPGVGFDAVRQVALVVREALADVGLVGWPGRSKVSWTSPLGTRPRAWPTRPGLRTTASRRAKGREFGPRSEGTCPW